MLEITVSRCSLFHKEFIKAAICKLFFSIDICVRNVKVQVTLCTLLHWLKSN